MIESYGLNCPQFNTLLSDSTMHTVPFSQHRWGHDFRVQNLVPTWEMLPHDPKVREPKERCSCGCARAHQHYWIQSSHQKISTATVVTMGSSDHSKPSRSYQLVVKAFACTSYSQHKTQKLLPNSLFAFHIVKGSWQFLLPGQKKKGYMGCHN